MPSRSMLSDSLARLTRWGQVATLAAGFSAAFINGIAVAQVTPPKGVVYVESNVAAAQGNQILAYKRDDAGSLTPIKGSPFSAGGTGVSLSFDLGPFDSDQEIITNQDQTLLFAVNGGSNSIAVFTFKSDGALVPVDGSPFPSGGSNPVSLGLSGNMLVAVNQDNDPGNPGLFLPSYATIKIKADGSLVPVKNSAFAVDLGSSPTQALVPPANSSLVFGCDFLGGLLRSFQLTSKGQLVPVDVQALPPDEFALSGEPPLPLGLWSHPKKPILYVGFVTINRIGVYRYNNQGQFEFLRSVPDTGNGVCWLRTNKAGTRLYASNTGDPSISVYDISIDPTEPIEIQKVVLNGMSNVFQITLDPAEEFFYAVTQRASAAQTASANALHVLTINADGTLTEVPSSPTLLPVLASSRPQGVLAF
jgi:6-phosphogluconolactonase (cycloisomerase 2 family)